MIATLRGKLLYTDANSLIVECGGVCFRSNGGRAGKEGRVEEEVVQRETTNNNENHHHT